ncbi:MAG: right-handed parallel beta-helix repeat-containing protein [Candidatus Cloacimonetes bacterium]|nr:right-handed parallel beta-helix repeat-containing protein [Candidatus Cloacimonadota bacterium]MDY0171931.1 NosD domain-containing protein [Candidatus Cloacimonadaceae bacterium]
MKRFIFLTLFLTALLGICSVMWATDINVGPGQTYTTIKDAIDAAATTSDTIVLQDDFTIATADFMHANGYALMISGKELTLDLNGHTISAHAYATIYIGGTGKLTLENSGGAATGKVINNLYEVVGNYGEFIMDGGMLEGVGSEESYALYNYYYNADMYGTATINDGTLTSTDRGIANCGDLTISGGSFNGAFYDIDNSGKLTITEDLTINKMLLKNGSHAAGVDGSGTLITETDVQITGVDTDSYFFIESGATIDTDNANNFGLTDGITTKYHGLYWGGTELWQQPSIVNFTNPYRYNTIQIAIDNANPEEVILVAAGEYTGPINVNKNVSIIGAGITGEESTQTIITGGSPVVSIAATGTETNPLLLKGFKIMATGDQGIDTAFSPIEYLSFENIWVQGNYPTAGLEGFRLTDEHSLSHWNVIGCTFDGFKTGIIAQRSSTQSTNLTSLDNVTFTDSHITNNTSKGMYIETLSNATFTNVTVTDNGNTSFEYYDAPHGIEINLINGDYTDIAFTNCIFERNGLNTRGGTALSIKARDDYMSEFFDEPFINDFPDYKTYPASLDGVTITGGTYTGNERGIRFGEPNRDGDNGNPAVNAGPINVTITGAKIYDNNQTSFEDDEETVPKYGDLINATQSDIFIDASNNYWGPAHPTYGHPDFDTVVGKVTYSPYYADVVMTNSITLPQQPVTNITMGRSYNKIQAALDGVWNNNVIEVSAGTYYENLKILYEGTTLMASDDQVVILDGGGHGTVVTVCNDEVTVKNFTIQHSGREDGDSGVRNDWSSDILVSGNIFKDNNYGIAACNFMGANTFSGNTMFDNYIGIYLQYAANNSIKNNLIFGNNIGLYFTHFNPSVTVTAERNYWGDPQGPQHSTNPFNSTTTGNAVSGNVTFMPWYATPTTSPDTEFATLRRSDGSRAIIEVFTSDELVTALANAAADDEIILGSGTFTGNFVIDDDITITAAEGAVPVIQGVDGDAALTIAINGVSIVGVTIQADADDNAVVVTDAVVDGATVSVTGGSIIAPGTGLGVTNQSQNNATAAVIATGNWWGGSDPAVSGEVDYGQEQENAPLHIVVTAPETLIKDEEELIYTVAVTQVTDLVGWHVDLKFLKADFDGPLFPDDFEINAAFDYSDYEIIADASYYIYRVSGSNLSQTPISNNVHLFNVELTSKLNANNTSGSLVTVVPGTVLLYGGETEPHNTAIPCTGTSGKLVIIDSIEPVLAAIPQPSGLTLAIDPVKTAAAGYAKVVDTALGLDYSDNYNLDYLRYLVQPQADAIPEPGDFTSSIIEGISGTVWDNDEADWPIPEVLLNADVNDLPTGDYIIYFLAYDDAGNYTISDWVFSINKTAPDAVEWEYCRTTPDANNSIDLKWGEAAGTNKKHVWVLNYAGLKDENEVVAIAYPEYNEAGFIPVIPPINPYIATDQDGWQKLTGDLLDNNATYTVLDRGYYYYAVFVEDAAGNMSTGTCMESISYWPGDVNVVDVNGAVDAADIALLSSVWGLTPATGASWNNVIDIGPSVDRARRGRPIPDNKINIEDLMMFAMNYENTDYDTYLRNEDNNIKQNPIAIEFETEIAEDQLIVNLLLAENVGLVQGLNIPLQYGSGLALQSVTAGDIWPQESLILHTNTENVVEVSVSTLGFDSTISENGTIATLVFQIINSQHNLELKHMIARDGDNNEIEIINNPLDEPTDNEDLVEVIPAANYLGSNYPNPFNPTTTIQFGLKEAQNVKITIYNTRGQIVKKLVNGMMPAGTHKIVWDGRDNSNRSTASGMYFYRMETPDYTKTNKAILMK